MTRTATGPILLANLSTGLLTEPVANILGSFLVTKIVQAAFRRASLPRDQRTPWYLYVDEFQNFMDLATGFDRILAEARKYQLVLAGFANQYVGHLFFSGAVAIVGNVGTMIAFRLGFDDARLLAHEFGAFTAEEILNLERGAARPASAPRKPLSTSRRTLSHLGWSPIPRPPSSRRAGKSTPAPARRWKES